MTTVSNRSGFAAKIGRVRAAKAIKLGLTYAVMIILAFIFMFPVVFMIVSSFKPNAVIFEDLRSIRAFVPTVFSLDNYHAVFRRTNFGRFMFNSIFIVTTTVALGLVVNSMAAYALARLRWKGRMLVLSTIIALLIIPFEAIAIPLLFVVNSLPWPLVEIANGMVRLGLEHSWLDTYQVQIVPFVADAFSIFLFYQFFLEVPRELDEAALVDGAGPFRIYWNILMPLSRPVLATVAILQFLVRWNDYLWPVLVTQGEKVRPLTLGMAAFFGQTPDWGQILAFATMITLPVLIVFLLFQRWFIRSVASSGLKG